MTSRYVPRLIDPLIDEMLAEFAALMLVGPRAVGKTTTALRVAADVLRLDRRGDREAAAADPDAALSATKEPVVIDEWQLLPDILGAVKRAVDADARPGRFVLTGSTAADLTEAGWPATGRVVRIPMWPLTQRELVGNPNSISLLNRLFSDPASVEELPPLPGAVPDVRGYIDMALVGGFPDAVTRTDRGRRSWLASYVDQLVTRDIKAAGIERDPVRLRRYLQAVAANTAGVVSHKRLYDAAEVDRSTGTAYDDVLQALLIVDHVPAWRASRFGRLVDTPKRYLTDTSLAGPLLGIDTRAVLRDADMLGRVIDTFVAAQLRPELAVGDSEVRLYHAREPHGRREVDLIVEAVDRRIVAIEIKAAAAPGPEAGRHLMALADRIGDDYVGGIVFHTGPRPYRLGHRTLALPICALWS